MSDTSEQEIIDLLREVQDAVRRQDREALERLLAPGFRLATTRPGNPVGRSEWIEAAVGPFRATSFTIRDSIVTIDGDTAVVSARVTQQATFDGQEAWGEWFLTDTWVKREGRWRLLTRHAEAVQNNRPE